ncbi:hypothetical protein CW702_01090 [Candidatus Bathyarchaeota archaeon]|nr:MAG: hypothetical protein CW702_01090 [Candidatus Bathyarchaeota archaeon]
MYQVFVRRMLLYHYQEMYGLTVKVLNIYFILSFGFIVFCSLIIFLVQNLFGLGSEGFASLLLVYFGALSLLWLTMAPLYAFKKYYALTAIFALTVVTNNIAVRILFSDPSKIDLFYYGIYLSIFSFIIYICTFLYLRWDEIRLEEEEHGKKMYQNVRLPGFSFIVIPGLPYAISGVLYFLILFTDRLVVWSGGMTSQLSVNLTYEAAANLSLFILVPVFGSLNYTMMRMYREVAEGGEMLLAKDISMYRRNVLNWYWRVLLYNSLVGLLSLAVLYFVMRSYVGSSLFGIVWINDVMIYILAIEGLGDILLTIFLINSLLFNYLCRPNLAVISSLPAVVVNLALSTLLVRNLGFQYACWGYLSCMAIASLISTFLASRLAGKIDYAYYSAF